MVNWRWGRGEKMARPPEQRPFTSRPSNCDTRMVEESRGAGKGFLGWKIPSRLVVVN
jgi:hypothetical protein